MPETTIKLRLSIDIPVESFQDCDRDEELGRILGTAARHVRIGEKHAFLRDFNGLTVGEVSVTEETKTEWPVLRLGDM